MMNHEIAVMTDITNYEIVLANEVKKYIKLGWTPLGSMFSIRKCGEKKMVQSMIKCKNTCKYET